MCNVYHHYPAPCMELVVTSIVCEGRGLFRDLECAVVKSQHTPLTHKALARWEIGLDLSSPPLPSPSPAVFPVHLEVACIDDIINSPTHSYPTHPHQCGPGPQKTEPYPPLPIAPLPGASEDYYSSHCVNSLRRWRVQKDADLCTEQLHHAQHHPQCSGLRGWEVTRWSCDRRGRGLVAGFK